MRSVWPGDAGKASSTAYPHSFPKRMRPSGIRQNGHSSGGKAFIVRGNPRIAEGVQAGDVFRPEPPPQIRHKADVSQVPVVTDEAPPLELLERHPEHDRANFVVQ